MYKKANWFFGAGELIARPAGGTPVRVATLQGVDIDIGATPKNLIGSRQYAEASVRAGSTISGKIQSGRFDGRLISNLFLGASETDGSIQTGLIIPVTDEIVTIGEDGTVTPKLAGATFDSDLGAVDFQTRGIYKWVKQDPASGEYTYDEATGEYSFAEADAGKKVALSYLKVDQTRGETTTIRNDEMGEQASFELISYDKKGLFIHLYACQFNKATLQRKNDDYLIPNLEFDAYADDVRGVGRISGA